MATLPTVITAGDPAHIDAHEALHPVFNLGTTAGDLIVVTGSQAYARLAIGAARQVLAANAGATALEYVASMQSLLTAQGDIIYASAANTPARLAKGTAAQVLTMNAGATAPEWATPAAAAGLTEFTIPAGAFGPGAGSPVLAETVASSDATGWLLDASSTERAMATFVMPTGWATFAVDLWWMNAAASSGNVAWIVRRYAVSNGGTFASGSTDDAQTIAAPTTAPLVKKSTFHAAGVAATAGQLVDLVVIRNGADAADTLANDAAFIGAHVRKVS